MAILSTCKSLASPTCKRCSRTWKRMRRSWRTSRSLGSKSSLRRNKGTMQPLAMHRPSQMMTIQGTTRWTIQQLIHASSQIMKGIARQEFLTALPSSSQLMLHFRRRKSSLKASPTSLPCARRVVAQLLKMIRVSHTLSTWMRTLRCLRFNITRLPRARY